MNGNGMFGGTYCPDLQVFNVEHAHTASIFRIEDLKKKL
jgi:hypothetical protein